MPTASEVQLQLNFCPRCGHALEDRFLFERVRRVCPACGFIFFRNPKVGAGVLVEQAGRVLLVQRAVEPQLGHWCLPSGFVEWDEGPKTAALRECKEETGLAVRITGLLGVFHYRHDFRGPGIFVCYTARAVGGTLRPADDVSAVRFFAPCELPADIAFASNRMALCRWRLRRGAQG